MDPAQPLQRGPQLFPPQHFLQSGMFTQLTLRQIGDLCFGMFLYTSEPASAYEFSRLYHVNRKWIRLQDWDRFRVEEQCAHIGHDHNACIARVHLTPQRSNVVQEPNENKIDFWTKIHSDLVSMKTHYLALDSRALMHVSQFGVVDLGDCDAVVAICEAEEAVQSYLLSLPHSPQLAAGSPAGDAAEPLLPQHFQGELSDIAGKMGWECVVCMESLTGDRFGLTPCFHKVCPVCIAAVDRCPVCRRHLPQ